MKTQVSKIQVSKRLGKTAWDHRHRPWIALATDKEKHLTCGICACLHLMLALRRKKTETLKYWEGFKPPRWARYATGSILGRIKRRALRAQKRKLITQNEKG